METEASIIYQILDEIRAGGINNDEILGERDIRSWMRGHRAALIDKATKSGHLISDSEFQTLGAVDLVIEGDQYVYQMPRIIRLQNNNGIKLTSATGNVIPVLSRDSFLLSKNNRYNRYMPKAYIDSNSKLYINEGISNPDGFDGGAQLTAFRNQLIADRKVFVEAILFDPSDLEDYDIDTSPYPLSSELISMMKDLIFKKNINIVLNTKNDEVTNMKNDNIRYHDQGKVD